jgi:hypothetical protein
MATGAGGFTFDETGNDEKKSESLYSSEWVPGVASSAQRIPYINLPVIEYNSDISQPSGAYWEPAAEIKWLKNSNNVLNQENTKLRLEIKVYKKIIKNLLKKK